MTVEFALVWLGLITLLTIGFEIMLTYATLGFGYGFAAKRPPVEKSQFAQQVEKTYRNQVESVTYLAPALIAAALLGVNSGGVQIAALLIVLGRAGFVLSYYTGISFVRVPFFGAASVSALYIYYVVLTAVVA